MRVTVPVWLQKAMSNPLLITYCSTSHYKVAVQWNYSFKHQNRVDVHNAALTQELYVCFNSSIYLSCKCTFAHSRQAHMWVFRHLTSHCSSHHTVCTLNSRPECVIACGTDRGGDLWLEMTHTHYERAECCFTITTGLAEHRFGDSLFNNRFDSNWLHSFCWPLQSTGTFASLENEFKWGLEKIKRKRRGQIFTLWSVWIEPLNKSNSVRWRQRSCGRGSQDKQNVVGLSLHSFEAVAEWSKRTKLNFNLLKNLSTVLWCSYTASLGSDTSLQLD